MNQEKKVSSNIPFGCLLTDIFVESGLVDFLTKEAKFTEYLIPSVGEPFNGQTLRNMKIIPKLKKKHLGEPTEVTKNRRIPIDNFPLFSKTGNLTDVAAYVVRMARVGYDMSNFDLNKHSIEEVDCSKDERKEISDVFYSKRKRRRRSLELLRL